MLKRHFMLDKIPLISSFYIFLFLLLIAADRENTEGKIPEVAFHVQMDDN